MSSLFYHVRALDSVQRDHVIKCLELCNASLNLPNMTWLLDMIERTKCAPLLVAKMAFVDALLAAMVKDVRPLIKCSKFKKRIDNISTFAEFAAFVDGYGTSRGHSWEGPEVEIFYEWFLDQDLIIVIPTDQVLSMIDAVKGLAVGNVRSDFSHVAKMALLFGASVDELCDAVKSAHLVRTTNAPLAMYPTHVEEVVEEESYSSDPDADYT